MNVRTLILAILNTQEATGYEIKKLSTEGVYSYFVDVSYGSIYPTLSKLEAEGVVTVRIETQVGKPDRKVYEITDEGRNEFVASLATPPAADKFKSEFLLVALTVSLGTKQTITKAIDDRIVHLETELAMISEAANKDRECEDGALSANWVCNYGKSIKEFDMKYLKENRDALIALAGNSTNKHSQNTSKNSSKNLTQKSQLKTEEVSV